ncbi:SRPBCC domain-containing protein [Flavobacterium sp. JAS]|uniref:SRPBCC family protein n=1 Tax=Flavobacterium sp. JAS TaxID=2897329 RepID=UPI001E475FAD|nr:SRPBCC domain-containing protein [Flavobacterium sp. JAS]MCD0470348.1 SRPBCC domain-containing protein [Flavobacterium sp. JAS]
MATDKILNKTISINAPISKVWNVLTNPEEIKEWLFGTIVISNWRVGDPILFTGSWQGVDYEDKGVILKFEIEKVFEYNYWSGFSGLPDSPENYSVILFELTANDDKTILTLTHSNFATETMYEHSDKNWDATLDLMKKIIEK